MNLRYLLSVPLLLGSASACSAEDELESWKKTQHFERAVSDTPLSTVLEQLTLQSLSDIVKVEAEGEVSAAALANFTMRDLESMVIGAYGPYALAISEYAHREISGALSDGEVDALFAVGTDPKSIEAVRCVYGKPAPEGVIDWSACSGEGHLTVPQAFQDAHVSYSRVYQAVIDGPRTQTYFGGISCRLLDQIEQRVKTDTSSIEFEGTTFGLTKQGQEDCSVLKPRLDALDAAEAAEAENG